MLIGQVEASMFGLDLGTRSISLASRTLIALMSSQPKAPQPGLGQIGGGIPKDRRRAGHVRCDRLEQFQHFELKRRIEKSR